MLIFRGQEWAEWDYVQDMPAAWGMSRGGLVRVKPGWSWQAPGPGSMSIFRASECADRDYVHPVERAESMPRGEGGRARLGASGNFR